MKVVHIIIKIILRPAQTVLRRIDSQSSAKMPQSIRVHAMTGRWSFAQTIAQQQEERPAWSAGVMGDLVSVR